MTDSHKKSLLSGLFWILTANLIVKPFWLLGIEVGVQNAVGAEMYGFYFGIFNITYIFNILLDLGITNFNTRNIAQHPQLIGKHLPALLGIKVLLLGLYVVVTFSVGALLGYEALQFRLLALLTFNQFLNSLLLYLRSNFEGLLLFRWDSLLSVLDRVLMIVICGLLLWGPGVGAGRRMTVMHFALAQTVAYLLTAALALTVLIRKTGLRGLRFNRPFTMAILKQSLPFALLVLLMASYNRIDPVLLQKLSPAGTGNHNAGIYAGAFRLLDALTMVVYLISVPLLPVFSKMVKQPGSGEVLRSTLRLMTGLVAVFAIGASCALAAESEELMALFYRTDIEQYAAVFGILIFGIIPIGVTYVYGTLLTAGGELRRLNLFATGALVLNVVVNLVCIPRWGTVGSAWAGLSAQTMMALAQLVAALRIYEIKPSGLYILKLGVYTLCVIAVAWLGRWLSWWQTLAAVAAVGLALALLLQLVDLREIAKTLRN